MASLKLQPDAKQGYNFKKDTQKLCGFIKALKIGDKKLEADQLVRDILDPESGVKVVGVLNHFEWDTSITGPLYFQAFVSTPNKQALMELIFKDLTKINIECDFELYEYDTVSDPKVYYKCWHSNSVAITGVVQKESGEFVLDIDDKPSRLVEQPVNYLLTFGMDAQTEQKIHVATSQSGKFVKQIGMDVT